MNYHTNYTILQQANSIRRTRIQLDYEGPKGAKVKNKAPRLQVTAPPDDDDGEPHAPPPPGPQEPPMDAEDKYHLDMIIEQGLVAMTQEFVRASMSCFGLLMDATSFKSFFLHLKFCGLHCQCYLPNPALIGAWDYRRHPQRLKICIKLYAP